MRGAKKLCIMSVSFSILLNGVLCVYLPQLAKGQKGRGKLYSTAAVKNFCKKAQQIIANTKLKAKNVNWNELGTPGIPFPAPGISATGFIGSNPTPYDGALYLPLSTQQYVGYAKDNTGKTYPQVIMCKMKSWDALNFYYPGSAASGSNCAVVNAKIGGLVVASLTNQNQEPLAIRSVVYDNWLTYTGEQWTDSSPAPVAYLSTKDGKLHILSKELYVARNNPSSFVGVEKKGINYCQVIAPDYLRRLLVGNITAPKCDPPPVYQQPLGQPESPKPWNCANPQQIH